MQKENAEIQEEARSIEQQRMELIKKQLQLQWTRENSNRQAEGTRENAQAVEDVNSNSIDLIRILTGQIEQLREQTEQQMFRENLDVNKAVQAKNREQMQKYYILSQLNKRDVSGFE